jgi:hypothetical protein
VSNELAPLSEDLAERDGRWAALEELNAAAENARDPAEAREIMAKAKALASMLKTMGASLEEAYLASKASLLAAYRLAKMLAALSNETKPKPRADTGVFGSTKGSFAGCYPSERGRVIRELGLGHSTVENLLRLARVPDPVFQRYIQKKDHILTINGALRACLDIPPSRESHKYEQVDWRRKRRVRAGVKTPAAPSLDEAYSLLVGAIGHLGGLSGGSNKSVAARSLAMDLLYKAEDLLRPYRGGYVE